MSANDEIQMRGVALRMATVALAAALVAAAHQAFSSADITASLRYAGAAAWGVVVSDIVRDVIAQYRRR